MSEPKPVYTITPDTNMGVNCPACGVEITAVNGGGYGCYCETCVDKVVELIKAQQTIVAWMQECGVSQVKIAVDKKYNRYAKTSTNGGGGVFYRFERLEDLKELAKPAPVIMQARLFEVMR